MGTDIDPFGRADAVAVVEERLLLVEVDLKVVVDPADVLVTVLETVVTVKYWFSGTVKLSMHFLWVFGTQGLGLQSE